MCGLLLLHRYGDREVAVHMEDEGGRSGFTDILEDGKMRKFSNRDDELVWNPKTKKYYRHGSCYQESHSAENMRRSRLVSRPEREHEARPGIMTPPRADDDLGIEPSITAADLARALAAFQVDVEAEARDSTASAAAELEETLRRDHSQRLNRERGAGGRATRRERSSDPSSSEAREASQRV